MKRRLYQLLRQSGCINTRQDAIHLLKEGRVTVDDRIVTKPDFQLDPKKRVVKVDGRALPEPRQHYYFMLNKPPKFLSHRKRLHGKRSVMELFDLPEEIKNRINPVGRLDYESQGLLLFTSDGDCAERILHPNTKLEKEYEVLVKGRLEEDTIHQLEQGITIYLRPDGRKRKQVIKYRTKPCNIEVQKRSDQTTLCTITLTEGKKRQIREMMKTVNRKVLYLKRIRIGHLTLDVPEGAYRPFTPDDVF